MKYMINVIHNLSRKLFFWGISLVFKMLHDFNTTFACIIMQIIAQLLRYSKRMYFENALFDIIS